MLPDIHRATQKFYIFLIVYLTGCTPLCFDGSSVRQFALNTKLSTSSVLLKHFVVIYQM